MEQKCVEIQVVTTPDGKCQIVSAQKQPAGQQKKIVDPRAVYNGDGTIDFKKTSKAIQGDINALEEDDEDYYDVYEMLVEIIKESGAKVKNTITNIIRNLSRIIADGTRITGKRNNRGPRR